MSAHRKIEDLRILLEDTVEAYLWSTPSLEGFIDQGYREFARITRKLTDRTTVDVAVLSVAAGSESHALSPLVIDVRSAHNMATGCPIRTTNHISMPDGIITEGETREVCFDREEGYMHFYPAPSEDMQVRLNVVRYPLTTFSESMDDNSIEINDPRHWEIILTYAASRAYNINDLELSDPQKSARLLNEFYIRAQEVELETRIRRRRAGNVSYGGL